jgi:hypothetical protein
MPLYFLLLDANRFHQQLRPALAASWRVRSFEPCCALCVALLPAVHKFAERYHSTPEDTLVARVATGLSCDRDFWRSLAGEVLWYSAGDIPEFQTNPESLCCLLAPEQYRQGDVPREHFAPIQQVHFGARDLVFGGGYYRPEHAGYNDREDVTRLADYLAAVDPARWTAADLQQLRGMTDEEERAEELDFVREWFPSLQELYRSAAEQAQMVVCEVL